MLVLPREGEPKCSPVAHSPLGLGIKNSFQCGGQFRLATLNFSFWPCDKLGPTRAGPGKGTRHVQRQVGFDQSVNLRRDGFHR
jgi:hypothetical protein